MNTRMGSLTLAVSGVVLLALACGVHKARIDDLTVGPVELLTVDGRPAQRAQSRFVTMVPMALVDPGPHTFRVRTRPAQLGAPAETLLVQGTVLAGKRYRFEYRAGTLELVRTRDGE
jgi:hypothetical protein